MNKGESIGIRKVGNGFIVSPEEAQHMAVSDLSTMVFNNIEDMNTWLTEHFKDEKD